VMGQDHQTLVQTTRVLPALVGLGSCQFLFFFNEGVFL
jgi:hypothetical protein